jgi:predicted flap endonuclease-1-like 5' DNA nuclease
MLSKPFALVAKGGAIMTAAPTDEKPMNSSDREDDDLTVIKGIGPARQQWLRGSLGVRTYRDLAALSTDEIESYLKAEGQIVSRSDIEQWIARAQELAAAADLSSGRVDSPTSEGEWQPFASFVVEFQAREVKRRAEEQRTTIHHMEADKGEAWPGIEGERLCQWMLEQVSEKVPREPEEAPNVIPIKDEHGKIVGSMSIGEPKVTLSGPFEISPEEYKAILEAPEVVKTSLVVMVPESKTEEEAAPTREAALPEASIVIEEPAAAPSVTVEIAQVRAFQPPDAETPTAVGEASQPFSGFVRSGEPFALEVFFELAGAGADDVVKRQTTYNAQFHVRNLTTRARKHLGGTKPAALVAGKPLTAMLPQVSLQPGLYRLRVLVTLQDAPPIAGYFEVPLLQVV